MKLYRTTHGIVAEQEDRHYLVPVTDWDKLICSVDLFDQVRSAIASQPVMGLDSSAVIAPIGGQEVWAAGVTYFRSRNARIDESKDAGGRRR